MCERFPLILSTGHRCHVFVAYPIFVLAAKTPLRDFSGSAHCYVNVHSALHVGVSYNIPTIPDVMLTYLVSHVSIFHGRYDLIFWVCCFVWALDRLMRFLRVLSFNPKFWNTRAEVDYDENSNIVRLEVSTGSSRSLYRHVPGAFYYVYLLNDLRFWESHPFTMASVQTLRESEADTASRRSSDHPAEAATLLSEQERDMSREGGVHGAAESGSTLTFIIRPYDGFTKRLREKAMETLPKPAPLRVLIEGPYGHTQPFHRYNSVFFIVGGTGIAVPLAYLDSLCHSTSQIQSIRIVWAVRQATFAADVLKRDLGRFVGHEKLSVDVFTTRDEDAAAEQELYQDSITSNFRLRHGRPDIQDEVDCAAADGGVGSLAVVASGPASMSDDARRAVVHSLNTWKCPIEFFHESFNW